MASAQGKCWTITVQSSEEVCGWSHVSCQLPHMLPVLQRTLPATREVEARKPLIASTQVLPYAYKCLERKSVPLIYERIVLPGSFERLAASQCQAP